MPAPHGPNLSNQSANSIVQAEIGITEVAIYEILGIYVFITVLTFTLIYSLKSSILFGLIVNPAAMS